MKRKRYNELMANDGKQLTQAEVFEGWHWCVEFDGLLVGLGMTELNFCECLHHDHPVYKTAPPTTFHTKDQLTDKDVPF